MIHSFYMVELTVADWPTAVAWYRDVLGLPLRLEDTKGQFAMFESGGGRLAIKQGQPEPGTVLLTFEVDDLAAELSRLVASGVELVEAVKTSDEGYRRAIIRDPDGHRLCLFEWVNPR